MGWGRFWHTTAPGRRQLVARVPSRRALSARPFPFLACDRDLGLWANQGCDPSVVPRLLPRNCAARDGTLRSGRCGIPKGRRLVSPDGSCFGRRAVFYSRKIGEDYSVLRVRLRIGRRSPSVRITLPKPSFPAHAARRGRALSHFPSSARTRKDEAEGLLLRLLPSFERKFHRRMGCVVREIEAPLRERH